jgi:hypothetical protein
VDLLWAKSHGIEILPEMRTSVDQSKVVLHEEYLSPFAEEDFHRYNFDDPSFIELLNSDEWTYPEEEQPVINRQLSRLLALDELDKEATEEINTYNLTPSEALQVKDRYPEWEAGINVKAGERYRVEDILWECIKDHITQDNWKLGTATLSLWKRVDAEGHAGTMEDPIPYTQNMALEFNKYYTQDGVLYLCIQAMTPGPFDLKDVPAHAQPIKQ